MNLDPHYNFDTEHFDAEHAKNFITAHPVIVQVLNENTSDLARNMNYISELVDIMSGHHKANRAYLEAVQKSKNNIKIARYITLLSTLLAAIIFIALYSGHILYTLADAAHYTGEDWSKTLTENRVLINASILNLALDTNTDFLKSELDRSNYYTPEPPLTAH